MKNIFSHLIAWITAADQKKRYSDNDLYELDERRIEAALNLKAEARRLGEAGIPAPASIQLSGPEQQIVSQVEKARVDYFKWGDRRLSIFDDELVALRLSFQPIVNRALESAQDFTRASSALIDEREPLLQELSRKSTQLKRELDEFKQRSGLNREADYPTGWNKAFLYAVMSLLIIIEGVVNASLFSQGLDSGLIGGFMLAGGSAFVNVVFCAVMGRLVIPWVLHKKWIIKLLGIAGSAISFSILTAIALMIAHLRDALMEQTASPSQAAYAAFVSSPFSLQDLTSWVLFFVSIAFGLIAMREGFKLNDAYPGFGRKSKRYLGAREEFDLEQQALRDELEEYKTEHLNNLEKDCETLKVKLGRQYQLIQDKENTRSTAMNYASQAEHCMTSLLTIFRTENQIYRDNVEVPAYFHVYPELKTITTLVTDRASDDRRLLDEQHAISEDLVEKAEDIKASIQAAFNRVYDRLTPLNQHLQNGSSNNDTVKLVA